MVDFKPLTLEDAYIRGWRAAVAQIARLHPSIAGELHPLIDQIRMPQRDLIDITGGPQDDAGKS